MGIFSFGRSDANNTKSTTENISTSSSVTTANDNRIVGGSGGGTVIGSGGAPVTINDSTSPDVLSALGHAVDTAFASVTQIASGAQIHEPIPSPQAQLSPSVFANPWVKWSLIGAGVLVLGALAFRMTKGK